VTLYTAAVATKRSQHTRTQQGNSGVMQPVSKKQISEHDSTIKLLLETVFSIWYVQSGYKDGNLRNDVGSYTPLANVIHSCLLLIQNYPQKKKM
jgi:hypothetical protein